MSREINKASLKINKIPVVLPIHVDLDTTTRLAGQVEERMKRLEKESGTVDTQRFAVQTAYEFAAEMYDLEKRHEQDVHDLVKALEHVASQLKNLEQRYHIDIHVPGKE